MVEVKVMSLAQFMKTASEANEAELEMMYSRIRDNKKKSYVRMDYAAMPLYGSGDSIYGGGDCVSILSHRKGYGYTIIDVGDRGDWMCTVHSKSKSYKDIAFYDGEFEEVYEELLKHF